MKTIEKITREGDTMIFEIIESRKELAGWMRDQLFDAVYSEYRTGTWNDDDSSIDCQYKDGTFWGTDFGDSVKKPNISNIVKMISNNCSTTVIYGDIKIVQNEKYGDWEVEW